jgi:hypothetical protein
VSAQLITGHQLNPMNLQWERRAPWGHADVRRLMAENDLLGYGRAPVSSLSLPSSLNS